MRSIARRATRHRLAAAVAILWWASVLAGTSRAEAQASPTEVVVSAAASLSDIVDELARAYGQASGARVLVNTGGSNALARQIVEGAPVGLFISADEAQMDVVERAGCLVAGSRMVLLANQLAVAVRPELAASVRSAADLTAPGIRRIAMGDPAAVPAGVYARRYLESLGIWNALSERIIPAGTVRLALAAVESGDVDAALVYRTDTLIMNRARVAFVVPADQGPSIRYPAAVVKGRHEEQAARFLGYLKGADARARFERAGFVPLAAVPSSAPSGDPRR